MSALKVLLTSGLLLGSLAAQALMETRSGREETYLRFEREYVNAAGSAVVASCDAGDLRLEGSCLADTPQRFADGPSRGLFLESDKSDEAGRAGWSCRARLLRAGDVLRVQSKVVCKKGLKENSKAAAVPGTAFTGG